MTATTPRTSGTPHVEPWPAHLLPDAAPLTPAGLAEQWTTWADGAAALGEDAAAARLRGIPGEDPVGVAYSLLLSGAVDAAARTLADHPDTLERPAGRLLHAAVAAAQGSTSAYEELISAVTAGTFRSSETLRLLATVADLRLDVTTADAAWWRLVHDTGADDLRSAVRFGVASVSMRDSRASSTAVRVVVVDAATAVARTGRSAQARRAAIRQIVADLRSRGDHQGAHLVLAAHLARAEPDDELRADLRALERVGIPRMIGFALLTLVCLAGAITMPIAALIPAFVARSLAYRGLGATETSVRQSLRPRRASRSSAVRSEDPARCRCWYTGALTDTEAADYLAEHLVPSATSATTAALTASLGTAVVARCPDSAVRWIVGPLGEGGATLALRGLLVRPAVPEDDTLRTGFYL